MRRQGRSCSPRRVRRDAPTRRRRGRRSVLIEGTPGKGYEPRGWELWAPLAPMYGAARYAEVADALRAAVKAHPQYGLLFYNLACCESLTGKPTEALVHLRRAIRAL